MPVMETSNVDQLEGKLRSMILSNGNIPAAQGREQGLQQHSARNNGPALPIHNQPTQNQQMARGGLPAQAPTHPRQPPGIHGQRGPNGRGNLPPQHSRGGFRQQQPNQFGLQQQQAPQQAPMRIMQRGPGLGPDRGRGRGQGQAPLQGNQQNRSNHRSAPSNFTRLNRSHDMVHAQSQFLEQIAALWLPQLEMTSEEFSSKDAFRNNLEHACQQAVIQEYPTIPPKLELHCFGSLSSGFGTPGSDMDLALVSSYVTTEFPRLLEKALLDMGLGVRLLSRTRVPIIKICEKPTPELYAALREERQKWDDMTPEERIRYDQTGRREEEVPVEVMTERDEPDEQSGHTDAQNSEVEKPQKRGSAQTHGRTQKPPLSSQKNEQSQPLKPGSGLTQAQSGLDKQHQMPTGGSVQQEIQTSEPQQTKRPPRAPHPWYREKRTGPLDFPKTGVGIQCDINFSNPLGLHNTLLLRCYSHCDVRVRLMVLLVKCWASRRKINSGYCGTLSSYGYVLMVLHYLVNIVQPPVCPNLQLTRKPPGPPPPTDDPNAVCEGWDVRFWRNEQEILRLADKNMLSHNSEPLGMLLRGFFHYYAQQGYDSPRGGFAWTQQVLSLRTPGGELSKGSKGWTGAKSTIQDNKEIRHRYLFAIEDPFELDHNVARTVTHNGIVAIRDEFRRAWRILGQVGRGDMGDSDLFAQVSDLQPEKVEQKEEQTGAEVEEGGEGTEGVGASAGNSEVTSAVVL